jgi:hypothetical protein
LTSSATLRVSASESAGSTANVISAYRRWPSHLARTDSTLKTPLACCAAWRSSYDLRLDAIEHPGEHGLGRLPDDPKDYGGYDEADDRVGERVSHPHTKRAKDHRQASEPVGSRMVAIGDQCRAVDLSANADAEHRHSLVAQKADHASGGKPT